MKRTMIVNYSTGRYGVISKGEQKPMIRIANSFLYKFGFRVGQKINVDYDENSVVITRK